MRQGDTATTERSVLTYELQKKNQRDLTQIQLTTSLCFQKLVEAHWVLLQVRNLTSRPGLEAGNGSRAVGPVPVCALGNTTAKTTITEKNNP